MKATESDNLLRCDGNTDIFFGPVPFLKSIAAVSWILAVLI